MATRQPPKAQSSKRCKGKLPQKESQTKYFNQNTKEFKPLQTGEVVRVVRKPFDRDKRWFKARVEGQLDIRSDEVRTEDGRVHRRNRRHLRQSKEPFSSTSEPASGTLPQGNQPCIPTSTIKPRTPKPTDQSIQNNAQPIRDNPQPVTVLSNQGPPPDPKLYQAFSGITIPFVSQERRGFNSSNFTINFFSLLP